MSKGIIDTIVGGLEIVAGIVLIATGAGAFLGGMLIAAGVGMLLTGVGTLLAGSTGGYVTAVRNPVKPWDIVYGRARIGGTIVYLNEWGDSDKYLDMVIVLAAHQCASVDELLFDGQRITIGSNGQSYSPLQQDTDIQLIERVENVVTVTISTDIPYLQDGDDVLIHGVQNDNTLNGRFSVTVLTHSPTLKFTYLCGGQPTSQTSGGVQTAWADYADHVYFEAMLGTQTLGQTFQGMINGTPKAGPNPNNPWTPSCSLLNKTAIYLQLHYDSTVFASGIPQISCMLHGKNDIYDPRTDLYAYTENSALCIADYLAQQKWGFKASYGTDIPLPQLIAAANICDETVPLDAGGVEPRYTCNGTFQLSVKRGEILQNMLTSCAGRLVFIGGQYLIYPAAFAGVSATITSDWLMSNNASGFRWRPTVSIRDLYNGVKGQYVSPANKWTASDFPGYAQDGDHGFNDGPADLNFDANLAADGGDRRWLDIQLPFTISPATAQRIAKIELLRRRNQGTGTFALNMAGYQFAPMDVIAASLDIFGWDGKYLEIMACRFKIENQQSGDGAVILLGVEIDVQETDPSIYEWSGADELNPQGYVQSNVPNNRTPAPPTNFAATPTQGIIVLTWTPPVDAYVTNGGHLELRYQLVASPPGIWISLGSADPSTSQLNVIGLVPLDEYIFEIRSVNAAGVPSAWVSTTATFPEPSAAVWMPNFLEAPADDPIVPQGDLTFAMNQVGSTSAPTVEITGEMPVNTPAFTAVPSIGDITVIGTGGQLLADRNYFIKLAVARAGSPSTPSVVESVLLPGGASTQQIVLTDIVWPPGSWDTWYLYASIDREEMLCVQQTFSSAPDSITITDLPNRASEGPAVPSVKNLRVKIKQLCHIGPTNGFVTAVGAAVGSGALAQGTIRCMHLAADRSQDTNPFEGGIDWIQDPDLAVPLLSTDDWTGYVLSVLTHKVDGSAPILNFNITGYDPTSGTFYCDPDPAGAGVGPGDVFTVRFKPQWNEDFTVFTDLKMVNGQYPLGTAFSQPARYGRCIAGPGKGQLVPVASHDNTTYTFTEAWVGVDETSIIIIEFPPWLETGDGGALTVPAYATDSALTLGFPATFLENGLLVQVVMVDQDGTESPDELSPVREFFPFNDVSYGGNGSLNEIARCEFGRGSDGGPAAVAAGDITAIVEIDEAATLQGWSIVNEGAPVGASTFDILRKPAGSSPDTAYTSILGTNLITIPDGKHDTVIFSSAFAQGVDLSLAKGDLIKCTCLTTGGTAPLSPVVRLFAGQPLPTAIDGTQTAGLVPNV